MVTNAEQQTDSVKQQMQCWTADVSKIVDAKSTYINWGKEDIPHQMMFDFDDEDDEFMRNFGMLINPETLEDGDFEGLKKLQMTLMPKITPTWRLVYDEANSKGQR
ncbi:unnamed protein product [Cylindrotheca closterium]|uniref:Uncharacterized protein n=1 Tax=Cylindrotheca closterium TaxID=2856 RepID=A0AAD2FEA4_9STRA|nr:unnamed protein product [Cylindrotheca closterium]